MSILLSLMILHHNSSSGMNFTTLSVIKMIKSFDDKKESNNDGVNANTKASNRNKYFQNLHRSR